MTTAQHTRNNQSPTTDPLAWWRAARFGLFIHWGIYAVPAGRYRGQTVPKLSEWIRAAAGISFDEYSRYARQFTAEHFDARQWVGLARDAGMKYLVITAKHHDGFAMYDSKVSDYNIVKMTPFGRDPMAELAEACRDTGVQLCFYYSQDLDWEHPHGGIVDKIGPSDGRDFGRYLDEKAKPQLRELLTQYGRVGLIWCDTPKHITAEQSRDLKRFIKSIQPECLVSGRIGHGVGDYGSLGDNEMPAGPVRGDWETPATMNHSWGHKLDDHEWKSADGMVRQMAGLAGKGVNFLLNVGPTVQGDIPAPSIERLHAIGRWMDRHAAAIHNTKANPFPYDFDWGTLTRHDRKLYVILNHPEQASAAGPFKLNGLRSEVTEARWQATGEPLTWRQALDTAPPALTVDLPASVNEQPFPGVIELTLAEPAAVDGQLAPLPDGRLVLPAHLAELHVCDASARRVVQTVTNRNFAAVRGEEANQVVGDHLHLNPAGILTNWNSTDDSVSWTFQAPAAGEWDVWVHSVAGKYEPWQGGHTLRVTCEGQHLTRPLVADRMIEGERQLYFAEAATHFGTLHVSSAGEHTLELKAEHLLPDQPHALAISRVELRVKS